MILICLRVSALLMHIESLRTHFLFSLRFSTPKIAEVLPIFITSNTSEKSSHLSMIFKALLSKEVVKYFPYYSILSLV